MNLVFVQEGEQIHNFFAQPSVVDCTLVQVRKSGILVVYMPRNQFA